MLGRRVRGERTRLGWTQQELAERAHVSVRTVREVERGRAAQRGGAAGRLAEVLRLGGGARIGVLGPLAVRVGGRPVGLTAEKQRSLLGVLGLHAGEVVGKDRIVDVLWGDRPPASWRNLVHTYVARLRGVLGQDAVTGTGGGYRLGEVRCDAVEFDALADTARRHLAEGHPREAGREWRTALGLWRGPVLGDLPDRVRVDPVAAAIEGRRTVAALAYAEVALACGWFTEAVVVLQPVAHADPLHEPLHARLVVALAGAGQQAAALGLFERVRARLDDQLGIRPGRELRDAQERVLRQRIGEGREVARPRNVPWASGSA